MAVQYQPQRRNQQRRLSKREQQIRAKKRKRRILFRLSILILILCLIIGGLIWGIVAIIRHNRRADTIAMFGRTKNEITFNYIQHTVKVAVLSNSPAVCPGVPCGSDTMSEEKVVYITLDDGPSELTESVLDIFDQYDVKATFFVTGQKPKYFHLIKAAHDRGHTIGLHTNCHDYATIYASTDAYFNDLDQIGQIVKEQIGYIPCFIRFPGGGSNTISAKYSPGIMTTLSKAIQDRGYQYYDWNVTSGDGASVKEVDTLVDNAINCSANNVVLLIHDGSGKEATVESLPKIIQAYRERGYVFKGLDRKSFTAHHRINN